MNESVKSIQQRYLYTLDQIAAAAKRAGRDPKSVQLVVVTKSQPLDVVRAAIEAGARILGENYPEEGVTKIQSLKEFSAVEWHMIGHVQSRKAQIVARNFTFMHSLDGLKLATRLNRFCGEAGRGLPTLLEFNVGGEESKSGWPAWDEARWPELLKDVAAILTLPHLQIRGLMAMPPISDIPEHSRPFFQKVRRLQSFLAAQFPQADIGELSMGTSTDFEVAVEEGSTWVRVGTAIVGPRK
jgi:pyridoxal phosphate enzyme (YggS family)